MIKSASSEDVSELQIPDLITVPLQEVWEEVCIVVDVSSTINFETLQSPWQLSILSQR